MGQWFAENWFELITTIFGGGGLWFTAFSIRKDAKARKEEAEARRVANLFAVTTNYRESWKPYFDNPQLARVLDPVADVVKQPVTPIEELFVGQIIFHTSIIFYATKSGLFITQEGSSLDIAEFLSLPIPKAVWQKAKPLQNHDFVAFIDSSLK